jgi:hypothetical protein
MSARSTKRADGRYSVTARLERPDGTIRRTYFYGPHPGRSEGQSSCGTRPRQPRRARPGRDPNAVRVAHDLPARPRPRRVDQGLVRRTYGPSR